MSMSQMQNNASQIQPANNSIVNQVKNAYQWSADEQMAGPLQTLVIGLGVAVLAPTVIQSVKPLAKVAIKSGVNLFEKTKGAIAETGEVIGDIVAEAKAEAAMEQAKKVSLAGGLMATSNTVQETQDS